MLKRRNKKHKDPKAGDNKAAWEVPFKFEDMDDDSAQFVFEQVKTLFNACGKIHDSFRDRAQQLITVFVPVISAMLGYGALNYKDHDLFLAICDASVFLAYGLLRCLQVIEPIVAFIDGCEPKKIIVKDWLKYPEEKRKTVIIMNECQNYQKKIDDYMTRNAITGQKLKDALLSIVTSPVHAAIFYSLLKLADIIIPSFSGN